jgi:hypothetical protein
VCVGVDDDCIELECSGVQPYTPHAHSSLPSGQSRTPSQRARVPCTHWPLSQRVSVGGHTPAHKCSSRPSTQSRLPLHTQSPLMHSPLPHMNGRGDTQVLAVHTLMHACSVWEHTAIHLVLMTRAVGVAITSPLFRYTVTVPAAILI